MSGKTGSLWKSKQFDMGLIKKLYAKGESTETIAKKLDSSNRTIARRLRYMGITIRKQPWELKGKESQFFKGPRIQAKGYWYLYMPEHQRADRRGRVLESVVIMEDMLGRDLKDHEIVHHIDHNHENNHYTNLFLTNKADHIRIHAFIRREKGKNGDR